MATKKAISAGTGRRKTATARVNLVEGSGEWKVNGVALEEYIPSEALRDYLKQPVAISGYNMEKVDVLVFAKGLARDVLLERDAVDGPRTLALDQVHAGGRSLAAAGSSGYSLLGCHFLNPP